MQSINQNPMSSQAQIEQSSHRLPFGKDRLYLKLNGQILENDLLLNPSPFSLWTACMGIPFSSWLPIVPIPLNCYHTLDFHRGATTMFPLYMRYQGHIRIFGQFDDVAQYFAALH